MCRSHLVQCDGVNRHAERRRECLGVNPRYRYRYRYIDLYLDTDSQEKIEMETPMGTYRYIDMHIQFYTYVCILISVCML